jgi:hypothetical protein
MISARGRRRADAPGLLQPFPQDLVIDKAPSVLHGVNQGAFVVARRRAGLLVFDDRQWQPAFLAAFCGRAGAPAVRLAMRSALQIQGRNILSR